MSEKKIDKTLLTKDAVVYSPSAEHKINGLLPQFMGCYKIIIQLWNWKCHSIQVCTFYDYLGIVGTGNVPHLICIILITQIAISGFHSYLQSTPVIMN